MNIETKINIGDSVYFLNRIKREPCPVCGGTGKIRLEREYDCPECKGKGTVPIAGQAKYEVMEGTVVSIHAAVNNNETTFTYSVGIPVGNSEVMITRNLKADKVWVDRDTADKQCAFMNLERRSVSIENVQVPTSFLRTLPCNEKLMRRLNEWRNSRKFRTEIYVDENLKLFDGYTSYLIYRMLGFTVVPVVVWPEDMRK